MGDDLDNAFKGHLLDQLREEFVPIDVLIEGLLALEVHTNFGSTLPGRSPDGRKRDKIDIRLCRLLQAACRAAKKAGVTGCSEIDDLAQILSKLPAHQLPDKEGRRAALLLNECWLDSKAELFVWNMPEPTFAKLRTFADKILQRDEDESEEDIERERSLLEDLSRESRLDGEKNGLSLKRPPGRRDFSASLIESTARTALSRLFYGD